jgi:hypothetical protein
VQIHVNIWKNAYKSYRMQVYRNIETHSREIKKIRWPGGSEGSYESSVYLSVTSWPDKATSALKILRINIQTYL